VDYRITPLDPPEEVDRQVTEMLADLARRDPDFRYALEPYLTGPAVAISPDASLVEAACRAVKAVRGDARLGACPGGTAAGWLVQRHGSPSIVLGPGHIAQAHGRVEWVEVQQVIDAARTYALLALEAVGKS
jgi:acetylornithine deacetylase/succinyl-diaminopimelate desuccinylase-like protein